MAQERLKLLNLLDSSQKFSDKWENKEEDIHKYLDKLGGFKLEDLIKEPKRLNVEHSNIQEQTQELAVTNYKTFIETAECSRELFNQFNKIEQKLDKLIINIPEFQKECSNFSDSTSEINNLRQLNSLTLKKNTQLLEILELPQLMNSFINDGLYEDALELATYVKKLCTKFADIPIFQTILKDVDQAWLVMLHQLLTQLKNELTLPKCVQIVGHIRRMETFTELELKLKFLQARGQFLDNCVKYIPKQDDSDNYLSKVVDITRVNLFNIITQYKAIFDDQDLMPNNNNEFLKHEPAANIILFTWINDKINDFLTILEENLKSVSSSSSLESILDQCMYFGLSFGKIGCDFRILLVPIFTREIKENFKISVEKATKSFEKSIKNFTLINKNLPNIPWKNKDRDPLQPPDSLLEFYPLAEYLNSILRIFNQFRSCAPIAIIDDIIASLENSLLYIAKSILLLYSQEQQAFNSNSKDAFQRLCTCFADDLIPYIQKCIHVIYPPNQLVTHFGISLQTMQEKRISFLNKTVIIEPIFHLLPAKVNINDLNNDEEINTTTSNSLN